MRNTLLIVLFSSIHLLPGCSTAPENQTAAEWLQENTIILEQLRSYDQKERQEGIHRFIKLGRDQGVEVVTYLLDDPRLNDYRIELVLSRILAEWEDRRAIPFLLRNIRSLDQSTGSGWDRGAANIAREGLMVFGDDPLILAAMEDLLRDADPRARQMAAEVLAEIDTDEAAGLLGQRLQVENDRDVRASCLLGVIANRHQERTTFLVYALADSEPEIRLTAWEALSPRKPPVSYNPAATPSSQTQPLHVLKLWAVEN